jgi:metal-responsive CopG/Arc/MetJ family transcriptional regulator
MARQPTLVQLDDRQIAALDERASSEGRSRSDLIRRAIDEWLGSGEAARIDRQIIAGYTRVPAVPVDTSVVSNAVRVIAEEPW